MRNKNSNDDVQVVGAHGRAGQDVPHLVAEGHRGVSGSAMVSCVKENQKRLLNATSRHVQVQHLVSPENRKYN